MKRLALLLVGAAAWCASGATTIFDNFPQWDGNITGGWLGQAQTLTTPVGDDILMEWRFEMAAGNTVGQVGGSVQTLAGGLPSGVMLWSDTAPVPEQGGVITFNNINLQLTGGVQYALVVDFLGYSGQTIHFSTNDSMQGNGMWFDGASWTDFGGPLDQKIFARYEAVPEPATILVLSFGLAGAAIARRRR